MGTYNRGFERPGLPRSIWGVLTVTVKLDGWGNQCAKYAIVPIIVYIALSDLWCCWHLLKKNLTPLEIPVYLSI
jgi:hypothetical protein